MLFLISVEPIGENLVWITLASIASVLLALSILALTTSALPRVILLGQSAYWGISYVIRPVVLLVFEPNPPLRDGISDSRISAGGYAQGTLEILKPILFGLCIYLIIIYVVVTFLLPRKLKTNEYDLSRSQSETQLLVLILTIGWGFRLASSLGYGSGLISTMQLLAVIGSGGLILLRCRSSSPSDPWLLSAALASELIWTVLSASKTPFIAATLFLFVRLCHKGWTRRYSILSVASAVLGVGAFAAFQEFKLTRLASSPTNSFVASGYPAWIEPILPIVQRFDQFSAVTDAKLAGASSWLSPSEFGIHAASAFLPQTWTSEKVSAGLLWNTQVRAYSLQNAQFSNVSLAEGYIAEGYVAGGLLGIVLEAAWIAFALVCVVLLVNSRQVFSRSLAVLCLAYPILFERGFLGGVETASKAIQVSCLVFAIWLLLFKRNPPKPFNRHSKVSLSNVNRLNLDIVNDMKERQHGRA